MKKLNIVCKECCLRLEVKRKTSGTGSAPEDAIAAQTSLTFADKVNFMRVNCIPHGFIRQNALAESPQQWQREQRTLQREEALLNMLPEIA